MNISTLYAATTFQAAALESVFHEVQHIQSPTYLKSQLAAWRYTRLETTRDLTLFELVNPALRQLPVAGRALSIQEHELIHTPKSEYPNTRTWARYLHDSWPDLDGLAWRPRLGGIGKAFVFFGDRADTAFSPIGRTIAATSKVGTSKLTIVATKASIRLI